MVSLQAELGEHVWLLGAAGGVLAAPTTPGAGAAERYDEMDGRRASTEVWTARDAWDTRHAPSGPPSPGPGGPSLQPAPTAAPRAAEEAPRGPPPYVRVAGELDAAAAQAQGLAPATSIALWAGLQAWLTRPARLEEVVARLEALLVEAEGWLVAGEDAQAAALYRGVVAVCRAQGLGVRATLLRATGCHADPMLVALQRDDADQSAQVLLAAVAWSWASLGVCAYIEALDARLATLGLAAHRRLARGHDAAAVTCIERMVQLQEAGAALLGRHRRPVGDYLLPELGAGLAVVSAERYGCMRSRATLLRRDPATARAYLQHLEGDFLDGLHARRLDVAGRRLHQIEALVADAAPCGPPGVHYVAALGAWTHLRPLAADGLTPAAPGAPCRLALWPEQLEAELPVAAGEAPQTVFDLAVRLGLRLSALALAQNAGPDGPVHVLWWPQGAVTREVTAFQAAAARQQRPALVAWVLHQSFAGSAGEACDFALSPATVRVLAQALLAGPTGGPGAAPDALAFLAGLRRRTPTAPQALRRLTLDVDVCAQLTPQLRSWIGGVL